MDNLTVLISASSIPSHPETYIIDGTLDSIRKYLPNSPIIVMADGLRSEFTYRAVAYAEFKNRLELENRLDVEIISYNEFLHQALMTRKTLAFVDTPYILFAEHDTPLLGEIPFDKILKALEMPDVNSVRLYHYAAIPNEHLHLFGDRMGFGLPFIRTRQYSQRPFVARTNWYKGLMAKYFTDLSRTYIEDAVYNVFRDGQEGGLWIYAPEGNMQRSTHAQGRGDDPKFGVIY